MKYRFEGNYIVAEAETLQENAVLISTQGAIQLKAPEQLIAPKQKKERKDKGVSHKAIQEVVAPLKEKLDSLPKGVPTFIPSELSGRVAKFSNFVWNYGAATGKRFSTKAVPGGQEVMLK